MWNKHSGIVLLSAGLIVLASCQKIEEGIIPVAQGQYSLTLEATKGMDTKALVEEGTSLKASWVNGEKVAVYRNGSYVGDLTAAVTIADPSKAILSGSVTAAGIKKNDVLVLIFPGRNDHGWIYTGQTGTLASVSSSYDYAVAEIVVNSIDTDGNIDVNDDASFVNVQSIYAFKFNENLPVQYFVMSSPKEKLVTSRSYKNGLWQSEYGTITVTPAGAVTSFVSLRNENLTEDDTYYFTVIGTDNIVYVGSKEIAKSHLGYRKFLVPSVTVTQATASKLNGSESNKANIL